MTNGQLKEVEKFKIEPSLGRVAVLLFYPYGNG